jgi:hypothetical protein
MIAIDLSKTEHLETIFGPIDWAIIQEGIAAVPDASAVTVWQFIGTMQQLTPEGAAAFVDRFCYAARIDERRKMAKFNETQQ